MKLYLFSIAPNPLKVQMFLAEKKITVNTIEINTRKKENLEPKYLRINPKGTIPCLKLDNGTLLTESAAICKYFDEVHPLPNLTGSSPEEKSLIEMWCRKIDNEGYNSVEYTLRNSHERFKNRAVPGNRPIQQIPDLSNRGLLLIKMFLLDCEVQLLNNNYIAGNKFSLADIYLYILIYFSSWIKISIDESNKNMTAWHKKVSKRKSSLIIQKLL